MGIEINLLSFIPLSIKSNNLFSSEASLKYFLIQALASNILLFSIIFFFLFINISFFLNWIFFFNIIPSSTLILKRGVAPFHFWFPNVIEGLTWINNFILITWQKIIPLIILSFCLNYFFFNFTILFSVFIGAINGLNQTSLRKLIAYSSINHLSWILARILNNENLWKIYFSLYSFLSFSIIYIFIINKIFNFNQFFSLFFKNLNLKLILSLNLLSLGGLPPFLGFFPKWLIIEIIIFSNFLLILFFLISFSLITLYFYIRICYTSLIINFNKINFNIFYFSQIKNNFFIYILSFFSIFGLILINLFYN